MQRKKIAKISSMYGLIYQVLSVILGFISRKIFLSVLGEEYLGLNATLNQLLGALAMSEMGVQTAIIYKLYKPVAESDHDEICRIVSIYKKIYQSVFVFIAISSMVVTPFLKYIITDVSIEWRSIYIVWGLMALTSATSYLLSYNGALIYADQKQYMVTKIKIIVDTLCIILKIIGLIISKNIFVYLIIEGLQVLFTNGSLLFLRKKMYPWFCFRKIKMKESRDVLGMVKEIFAGKISAYIFNSTDNIVVSALISTKMVGFLTNYTTIINAIKSVIFSIAEPIQILIGNYLIHSREKELIRFIKNYTYVLYMFVSLLLLPTALLINDFVVLFFGDKYVMNKWIVQLLIFEAYLVFNQVSVGGVLDASGKFKEQKQYYIISSIINIVLSVWGAVTLGIEGVILGTVVGDAYNWYSRSKCVYYEIVQNKKNLMEYVKYNMILMLIFLVQWMFLDRIYAVVFLTISYKAFVLKGGITVLIVLFIQYVVFGKSTEYRYAKELLMSRITAKGK